MNDFIEKRLQQFIALRDKIAELEKKKQELSNLKLQVSVDLQKFLAENKIQNLKSKFGTCYIIEKQSATIADAEAFRNYVIQTAKWELTDWRANATACFDFAKDQKTLPPGVNLNTHQTLGVRRPDKKDKENGSGTDSE